MLYLIIKAYFYLLAVATLSTVALILAGKSWGHLPHRYLKAVLLLQSYFTEDGVVLGSIERSKSAAHRWLFGRSPMALPDEILEESKSTDEAPAAPSATTNEPLAVSETGGGASAGSAASSDFEQIGAPSNGASDGDDGRLAGAGLPVGARPVPPFGWHLELLRDGIESIIQDEISDIFAQSAAYRNAEPRSLRDLFFHFSRKRRRRRLQMQRQRVMEQQRRRIAQQNAARIAVSAANSAVESVEKRGVLSGTARDLLANGFLRYRRSRRTPQTLTDTVMHEEESREDHDDGQADQRQKDYNTMAIDFGGVDGDAEPGPTGSTTASQSSSTSARAMGGFATSLGASSTVSSPVDESDEPPLRFRPFLRSCFLLMFSRFFRIGILFPIRLSILLASFLYLAVICLTACFIDFSPKNKTKLGVIYCRLFNAGTGLVARYHNPEHRPKRPGVAVANHLSPNDIQIICADVEKDRDYLYILTGQKHHGIIWTIERLVERMCPSIWLERASAEDRKKFTQQVLDVARVNGPLLIFPEGYCTNNQKVLQFRRAVFDEGIVIYPIAIRQDARFGDSYWSEDLFVAYLLRILTSWAVVYDVYYLPSRQRRADETSTEFAFSVQGLIAERVGLEYANFDAGLFYKQSERLKYLALWNAECAKRVIATLAHADVFAAVGGADSLVGAATADSAYMSSTTDGTISSATSTAADMDERFELEPELLQTRPILRSRAHTVGAMSVSESDVSRKSSEGLAREMVAKAALAAGQQQEALSRRADESSDSDVEIVEDWPPAYAVGNRVLKRRRYNSLHVLKRRFSEGYDDNSDNAQLMG